MWGYCHDGGVCLKGKEERARRVALFSRPSHRPAFDCLQYAKTKRIHFHVLQAIKTGRWEGLGTRLGEESEQEWDVAEEGKEEGWRGKME